MNQYASSRPQGAKWLAACLAAPVLTLVILLISMAATEIYPFGDHAFAARDGVFQYAGFFGWFNQVLNGNDNLFYSFNKGLGGGTFALFAYYLSSPLMLLAKFIAPHDMATFFSFLMPAKLCLASFSFAIYITKRLDTRSPFIALLGSAYALTAWSFADGQNLMWIEGLIMLPLVALGAWRISTGNRPFMLMFSAALAILFNWYTAYMVCLFSIPYFFCELAANTSKGKRLRATAQYGGSMILAVLMGMIILLPVALSQLQSDSVEGGSWFFSAVASSGAPLSFSDYLKSMLHVTRDFSGAGNSIYLPLWLDVLAIAAFASRMPKRLKIGLAALAALLVASFLFKPLDMVWTGFVRSDSYNPRYSFLLGFLACTCAAWTLKSLLYTTNHQVGKAPSHSPNSNERARTVAPINRTAATAICAVSVALISIGSAHIAIRNLSAQGTHGFASTSVSGFKQYMQKYEEAISNLKQRDQGTYRIGNATSNSAGSFVPLPLNLETSGPAASAITTPENMALGYSTPAHYSSTGSGPLKQLLGNLGYCTLPGTRGVTSYHDPVLPTDSVLGIRYIIDTQQPPATQDTGISIELPEPYSKEATIYQSPSALPLGFAVSNTLADVSWTSDPFTNQQLWISSLVGKDLSQLYVEADVSQPTQANQSTCEFVITATSDGPLYLWVSQAPKPVSVSVDGAFTQFTGNYEFDSNIISLGDHVAGDKVTIALSSSEGLTASECRIVANSLNTDVATNAIASLSSSPLTITSAGNGKLAGTISVSHDQNLLITLPAENGWTAWVDGEEVALNTFTGLIALPLSAGDHAIELSYQTPGLKTGAILTAMGFAGAAVWLIVSIYRGHRSTAPLQPTHTSSSTTREK